MRLGTCLGFDFYTSLAHRPTTPTPSSRPSATTPASSARLKGPATNRTSSYDNYTISPSNTTAANSSYSPDLRQQLLPERRLRLDPDPGVRFVHQHRRRHHLDGPDDADAAACPRVLRHHAGRRRASVQDRQHHHLRHERQGRGRRHAPPTPSGSWTATRPIPRASRTPRAPAASPRSGPRRTTATRPASSTATPRGRAITARPSSSGRPTRAPPRPFPARP